MTYFVISRPSFWSRFEDFLESLVSSRDCETPNHELHEDSRARRDFMLEMLDRNPEAFQSEFDVQNMARLYRCRF